MQSITALCAAVFRGLRNNVQPGSERRCRQSAGAAGIRVRHRGPRWSCGAFCSSILWQLWQPRGTIWRSWEHSSLPRLQRSAATCPRPCPATSGEPATTSGSLCRWVLASFTGRHQLLHDAFACILIFFNVFLCPIRTLRCIWGSPSGGMWDPERLWKWPLRSRARRLHLRLLRRLWVQPRQDGLYRWAFFSFFFPATFISYNRPSALTLCNPREKICSGTS